MAERLPRHRMGRANQIKSDLNPAAEGSLATLNGNYAGGGVSQGSVERRCRQRRE